ncbi:glycosyl transferase family 2 [Flammeovirgaceae bacterium 311]|nr:glycosyl transferase family 2 [Flammeovirgaceae bacterium 311]
MQHKLAIVILNYNGAGFLKKFLPTVLLHSKGYHVVVADNASTDESVSLLQNRFPEVELIQLARNWGFAGGYNMALKQVSANYYLLLNSDVEVSSGWLEPMVKLLDGDAEIAACQPKIKAYHQPDCFEYAGASGGFLDFLGYPFCRGRLFDTLEEDRGQYDIARPIFWATGACMLLRAEKFWQLGGFDPDFFAHMEEIDLCWRMHAAGLAVWVVPQSVVYHVGGGTLAKENPRKTYLNFRNGLWMLIKNCEDGMAAKIGARMMLDWAAALQFISKGNFSAAQAILKSHIDTFKSVEKLHKKRQEIKKNRCYKAPLYQKLLVWEYFFRKRRYFSQLKF